jgi:copper(I)-binding protein
VVAALGNASAREALSDGIRIQHARIRATSAGAVTSAAYFDITNSSAETQRLIGASTTVAERVEIHTMSMDGGVMRMRSIGAIDIAPGATVELRPGGLHLMLIALRKPMRLGEMVPMILQFAGGKTVDVDFQVEAMGAGHGAHEPP